MIVTSGRYACGDRENREIDFPVITAVREIVRFLRPINNPLLQLEQRECPAIRKSIVRPYINQYWGMGRRLREIANHYLLVRSRAPFFDLRNGESAELAQYDIEGTQLRIVADRPKWMRGEGQLGISLFYGIDRIYTAMLHLSGTPDNMKLVVGNLQGDGRDRLAIYKTITKAMHGMRPRDFLAQIVKIVAGELGCLEILCISDAAHRSSYWLSSATKLSTYDEIWLEHGAVKDRDSGFFTMPPGIRKRADDKIPANKRGMYRRRYELLDGLRLTLRGQITAAGAQFVPPATDHRSIRPDSMEYRPRAV
jgi:uncharacterized protein VirK/YbjX